MKSKIDKQLVTAQEIDALLPQTQCGECGYKGCLPYAQALAKGIDTIDKCPPGGVKTIKALAGLLETDAMPFIDNFNQRPPAIAVIVEDECIGCTKCIKACPVDAIIGQGKLMHSILTHECTGCGLCIDPCPVDCIEMQSIPENNYDKNLARKRYQAKEIRLLRLEHEKAQKYRSKSLEKNSTDVEEKKSYILQALERVSIKKKTNIGKSSIE